MFLWFDCYRCGGHLRFLQHKLPAALGIGALLKFAASLPTVLFALKGYQVQRTKFGWYILLAIGLGMIADVLINISFAAGGIIFLLGHLLYDAAFLSESKPSARQVILWLGLSTLMLLPLYLLRDVIGSMINSIGLLLYVSILISTVVFSWSLEKQVFMAALIFAFSDCFLLVNNFFHGTVLMRILALLIYYGSLLLYGAALWQRNYRA